MDQLWPLRNSSFKGKANSESQRKVVVLTLIETRKKSETNSVSPCLSRQAILIGPDLLVTILVEFARWKINEGLQELLYTHQESF